MAEADASIIYPSRFHLNREARSQAARERCCSNFQYRGTALFLFAFGAVLIALAEVYNINAIIYIGSFFLFIGVFMLMLDLALYFQGKGDRQQRRRLRLRARNRERRNNVW